jgi:hypothetical protein
MESSILSAPAASGLRQPQRRPSASRVVFIAIGTALLLSAVLCPLSCVGDPTWRFRLFQVLAIVFFVPVLLRNLPRRGQAADVEPPAVAPQSARFAGLLVALAAGASAYAATIPLYFICDDFEHLALIRHPFMTSLWPQLTKGQFDGLAYIFYRPVGFASLFLDFRLWHYWAPGYHLTNVSLHLLCIAAVFFFCKQLQLKSETCMAASLIFAVLPVNVQAVTWIGCRFDQLATTLGMWSLTSAAHFRRTGKVSSYAMAILFFALAVTSKESAYVVPILWLALELIPQDRQPLRPPFARSSAPLLGYVLAPLLMLFHRLHTLGGIGGYRLTTDGSPLAQSFRTQSLVGILIRAPAETLFGYNWLQPSGRILPLAAGATAAIFLTLCLLAKPTPIGRRITWFCLIWVFVAPIPTHFYFRTPDPGLFSSRAVYFGSIGVSLLLAVLLSQTFSNPKVSLTWAFSISLLLLIGLHHNVGAWRSAAQQSRTFLSSLDSFQPTPPPRAVFFIKGIPDIVNGVPFFTVGLENAVRFHYSWRDDIRVRTEQSRFVEPWAITIDMTSRLKGDPPELPH